MFDFSFQAHRFWINQFYQDVLGWVSWKKRMYGSPSPRTIKLACLLRNGFESATWVETGTYLGQTTYVLATHGGRVFSIEPQVAIFENAKRRLARFPNVKVILGTSETVFPELLPDISGDVNFWLDGHASGGITYEGKLTTPILLELDCISQHRSHFGRVCVLIDDLRLFGNTPGYPSLDAIVKWAQENRFSWHIEHDIFVALSDNDP